MFFQLFLKGMPLPGDPEANSLLTESGILCNWWRKVTLLPEPEIKDRLTERNLLWHLNHYDDADPMEGGESFGRHTPYISTTAGTVERDPLRGLNIRHEPLLTALEFATNSFRDTGYVFYGYVFTLGKKAIPLREFAEEVRELNIYQSFLPYHNEGEITAKISIPVPCLEKYEKYDGPSALHDLRHMMRPQPISTQLNPYYADPIPLLNLRGLI